MKPLARKAMSIIGLVLATLGCCSLAYGEETLNLELLCEGSWGVELNMLDKSGGYEQLFLDFLMAEFENGKKEFSERLSIQENMLDEIIPLQVTETSIVADFNEFPEDVREDFDAAVGEVGEVQAANVSIDRLTGKIEGRFEFKFDEKYLQSYTKDNLIILEVVKMLRAFTIEGQCEKLVPKKKLF